MEPTRRITNRTNQVLQYVEPSQKSSYERCIEEFFEKLLKMPSTMTLHPSKIRRIDYSKYKGRNLFNLNKPMPPKILNLPKVIIQELFIHFFTFREISTLSLVNRDFRIHAESPVVWNKLCCKIIKNNTQNQFIYLENGNNAKKTVKYIYKIENERYPPQIFDKYGYHNELINSLFGGIEHIMALPLVSIDHTLFGLNYPDSLNRNPQLVEALKQAPSICKICIYENLKLSSAVWIAIQLDAYIRNPASTNTDDRLVVPGVCVFLDAYHIKFSFLTDKSAEFQDKLNPGCMDSLFTKYHAQWFQRLLKGEKCGQKIPEWIPNGCPGEGEWEEFQYCKENCEEMYFMLHARKII